MHHPLELLLGPIEPLLTGVIAGAKADGISLESYTIDHVCYRTNSIEEYTELRRMLDCYGKCIGEYVISGRPIATFLLDTPIEYENFKIECLELPAPKNGKQYEEKWEHAECSVNMPLCSFLEKYPNIAFDVADINKPINPEIERKYDTHTLKFHEHTLRYVVEVLQA